MKRPSLVFGLVTFTLALLFFFLKSGALFGVSLITVTVFLFYIFTKKEKIKELIIIPTVLLSVLISVTSLFINNIFYEKATSYKDSVCNITGTVIEASNESYVLKTSFVNNKEAKIKIAFKSNEAYTVYDNVFLTNAEIIESTSSTDVSKKIFLKATSFSEESKLGTAKKDFYYYVLNIKYVTLEKLSDFLTGDSFGVASGMLFGGTDEISNSTQDSFRKSGVAHLLAVSGLHTSLWCGLVLNILNFFKLKERYANLCGILMLVFLCIVSGFTPSVIRASFMMGITLLGPLFKKHSDSTNSLGLAAGVILLINPFVLYSPSFFLSFLATLGVVLSSKFNYKLLPFLERKNLPFLAKKFLNFVYTSLLISLFSTLFTLPASVYYFGTVSIIAPLTNLLTLNVAFIAMVLTLISLVTGFFNFELINYVSEFLFEATDFILNFLIKIINLTGSFRFSSITATPLFVYCGLFLTILIFIAYCFISKSTKIKFFIKRICAVLIPVPVIISLILSIIPFDKNTSFTILGDTDTPNVIIKSGTHYVVINIPEKLHSEDYKFLPKSNNDTLDLFVATHVNKEKIKTTEKLYENYNVEKTLITNFVNDTLYNFKTDVFNLAEVSSNYSYSLKNEVNIRIFDTYGKNCAIIDFDEKTIVLSFSEYNNLNEIKTECGKIDVLVLPESIPDTYNLTVDTLIVCSAAQDTVHKNDKLGDFYSKHFYKTSIDDNVTLDLKG